MIQKFRKKPIVVEAIQWTGVNYTEIKEWGAPVRESFGVSTELLVETLEDGSDYQVTHSASLGDWIIKGIKGEFYPCKNDIFKATYELETEEIAAKNTMAAAMPIIIKLLNDPYFVVRIRDAGLVPDYKSIFEMFEDVVFDKVKKETV